MEDDPSLGKSTAPSVYPTAPVHLRARRAHDPSHCGLIEKGPAGHRSAFECTLAPPMRDTAANPELASLFPGQMASDLEKCSRADSMF